MKFLTFMHQGFAHLGWLLKDEQTVLSVDPKDDNMPQSIVDLIKRGPYAIKQLIEAQEQETLERHDIHEIELLEPLVPGSIFCIGLNYSDHASEVGKDLSEHPTLFFRLPRSHVAHRQPLLVPTCSKTLDWEGELVVVIGKRGRHIATDHARAHIFGYSIYNEGSVREFQKHSSQFGLGKNFQASGAFGPVIVTADEFGDPYDHEIQTRIDGELVQSASTSLMLHRIENLIAYLSTAMELHPGDIICTGTPGGVGVAQKPRRFLRDGETIEVSISGIGTLVNPIRDEPTDLNAVACTC